jgi:hypothetical protein
VCLLFCVFWVFLLRWAWWGRCGLSGWTGTARFLPSLAEPAATGRGDEMRTRRELTVAASTASVLLVFGLIGIALSHLGSHVLR